jgi:hypothetical protein
LRRTGQQITSLQSSAPHRLSPSSRILFDFPCTVELPWNWLGSWGLDHLKVTESENIPLVDFKVKIKWHLTGNYIYLTSVTKQMNKLNKSPSMSQLSDTTVNPLNGVQVFGYKKI